MISFMAVIGFTSTIPVEVIFAAGHIPLDLNNIFVAHENPSALVARAKLDGFPDTTCSWICGLYGTALSTDMHSIVGVTGGDCSETLALMEVLKLRGRRIIPFSYPHDRDESVLRREIEQFCAALGTTIEKAEDVKKNCDTVRTRVRYLDQLLWKKNKGKGNPVRLIELSCTDFEGDIGRFAEKVEHAIIYAESLPDTPGSLRLGVCGVPPIVFDLYEHIERDGNRVVFSEVERQFSIPYNGNLPGAYRAYTYPYGIFARIEDIGKAVEERALDGIIHYVQSFCFRSIEDIALRASINVPILTLQGDLPSKVTETMEIRIEAFLDMLARRKERARGAQ
jgi:benzoyl-CoA reductase/2-hydroxyglutaryl-CoA dehydratase subunit BcrC/BadD/HgdB